MESNNCISDLRGFVVMSRGNAVYNTTEMQVSKREEQDAFFTFQIEDVYNNTL